MTGDKTTCTLPELLSFPDGKPITNSADWHQRREQLLQQILDIEYGAFPPPAPVSSLLLHQQHEVKHFGQARHAQYRLTMEVAGHSLSFILDLMIPKGTNPMTVILAGDGCWRYVTDEITQEVLARGYILAQFNRTELAADNGSTSRDHGLYTLYPKGEYGALTAWAWGYHRCVDFLLTQAYVNPEQIAIVGHSRGGKSTLLAGATDSRIALTGANDSGCCGAGCFRYHGPKAEKVDDILKSFSYWFSPKLKEYVGREAQIPFDQHALKALIAPRALLTTEAWGDLWANPEGTWITHQAAREVYRFLGVPQRIAIAYREGTHEHHRTDWQNFLNYADFLFRAKPLPQPLLEYPARSVGK